MPRFVSKAGVWHPEKERIALKNLSGKTKIIDGKEIKPDEDYIYEGGDRAALFELHKANVKTLGQDFRRNTEFLQSIRNMGFGGKEGLKDYLEFVGYDEKKEEEEFNKKASVIHTEKLPEKVKAIETLGGGIDTTGGEKPKYGGFGSQPGG